MQKTLRQKFTWQAVLELEFKDLQNKFHSFKSRVAGTLQKHTQNFRETSTSQGWLSHETAITLINEWCSCGKDRDEDEDEFQSVETVSSPSPVGTPQIPEPVPLQVALIYQVGWITRLSFGKATDLSIADATSSGRDPFAFESGGLSSTWSSEGSALIS